MNARLLQTAIINDLKCLFQNRRYKSPDPLIKSAAPSLFRQNLPKKSRDDEDDPFPHIIVRIDSGGIESPTEPHTVAVVLMVGIFDDDEQNVGSDTVLEIFEIIQQHYQESPTLEEQFVCTGSFHWALQDEESFPYFYGAANINFKLPAPRLKGSDLT